MSDTEDLRRHKAAVKIYIPVWLYGMPWDWQETYFNEIAGVYAVSCGWGNA